MAVRTKDEILAMINQRTGDSPDDDTLTYIADITDTLNDYESRVGSSEEWKKKYEENDASWRKKYKERFFTQTESDTVIDDIEKEEESKKPRTFEELFKVEKRGK